MDRYKRSILKKNKIYRPYTYDGIGNFILFFRRTRILYIGRFMSFQMAISILAVIMAFIMIPTVSRAIRPPNPYKNDG